MSDYPQPNAIYYPEGAGYLLVKVLQTVIDDKKIESDVTLVKSLEDNKLYIRKEVQLSNHSLSGIPNEIEFNPSFSLIPRVKDITKYVHHPDGHYYWATTTEFCNGGDLRRLVKSYGKNWFPEILIYKYLADMIKILNFLSQKKILHKDIYPQNIFLRYSDDSNDCLPDFVLGDFGWAVPLTDENSRDDILLFIQCAWAMFGYGEDDGYWVEPDFSLEELESGALAKATHCVGCLHNLVSALINAAYEGILSVDYLVTKVLPVVEDKLRQLRPQTTVQRHLTNLSEVYRDNNGNKWPEKLQRLSTDWQLVNIIKPTNVSDKITFHGLGKATKGRKKFLPFSKYAPDCLDLDLVYRFNANGLSCPPEEIESDGLFKGMTFEDGFNEFRQELEMKAIRKDRESDTQECRRKRRKLNAQDAEIAKQDPAKIDAEQSLLTEAGPSTNPSSTQIATVDQATLDDAGNVEPGRAIAELSSWHESRSWLTVFVRLLSTRLHLHMAATLSQILIDLPVSLFICAARHDMLVEEHEPVPA